jgi:cellulose synthase/poly-beta-1,6-N-acetylglucosamine synthase-like glycosyltransferase
MATLLQVLAGLAYLLALLLLSLYGLNACAMLAVHWRNRGRADSDAVPPPPAVWPAVTIQLPVYNERYVARRLLDAVARLDYPVDRIEIQILDDSTDDTTAIIAETARRLVARGLRVVHIQRRERTGFKAGALAAGHKEARGEFLAIFDADAVPPPDFLRRTIPHFADSRVAVVQARWDHLNRDFSLLTVAQSLAIDGHFAVEQSARCWGNLFLNFNGTAGVWRKEAVDDAGGWSHDTLTEDLDLSYRAQLRGWRIVYRPELSCPAELPVLVTGFKSQQSRWARGSIQTARKLLPALLRAPLSPWVKYQGCIHLTYYMIYPLMLAVGVLVPLLGLGGLGLPQSVLVAASAASGLALFGTGCMLVYAQRVLDPAWLRRLWRLPSIMVVGVGVALSTSLAVLDAFWRKDLVFIRTPKFGIGPQGGHWRGKAYRDRRPWGGVVEMALGVYCAWSVGLFWQQGQYGIVPFVGLYAAGFLTVGTLTILHTTAWRARPRARPVTGPQGSASSRR